MQHDEHPATVRELVIENFRSLGVEPEDLERMSDTILIRDGHYYGRSFRAGHLLAMWMSGLVQFYGPDGQMLRTLPARRATTPQSRAA